MRTHSLRSLNIFEGVRWYLETMSLREIGPQLKLPIRGQFQLGTHFMYSNNIVSTGLATYFRFSFRSRGAVVSYWRKYVHEVLVNHLGGLSSPRKSVVRLTDRPDMTVDVYRGRKTTTQQQLVV